MDTTSKRVAQIKVEGTDDRGDTYDTPWAGTLTVETVEHTYYGMHNTEGRTYLCCQATPAWVVEFAGDRANAERIVANAAAVSEIVSRHGGHARVRVSFEANTMTVAEYDYSSWTETVEGAI